MVIFSSSTVCVCGFISWVGQKKKALLTHTHCSIHTHYTTHTHTHWLALTTKYTHTLHTAPTYNLLHPPTHYTTHPNPHPHTPSHTCTPSEEGSAASDAFFPRFFFCLFAPFATPNSAPMPPPSMACNPKVNKQK